jgi:hypothetical protein
VGIVAAHLTKLLASPARDPRAGWAATVRHQRQEIERLLRDNPSLRRELAAMVEAETRAAVRLVALELRDRGEITSSAATSLAATFTPEQVLGDWWPEPLAGTHPEG